jgi:hypothetical protein
MFNDLLRELAEYPAFRGLVKLQKKNEENATREELVLKFFAYLNDRSRFNGAVTEFLSNYMEDNRDNFDVDDGRKLFHVISDQLGASIGGPFLRATTPVTPQSELEAVLVASAEVIRSHGRIGKPLSGWLVGRSGACPCKHRSDEYP